MKDKKYKDQKHVKQEHIMHQENQQNPLPVLKIVLPVYAVYIIQFAHMLPEHMPHVICSYF